ncbi:MAG TPA: tyrosine-type recombinase/integrase [Phycisphaerae bacterium]|nr:tyrosine-type recombinase/integrase [Phycisphaerae bacterium]HRY69641.1 tyrosine-type recombinase/integrase [Phycisphaerae bacterium]HSA27244.1 tyrosine-type recombinase/integrase [Phycisphaerae bacterium]
MPRPRKYVIRHGQQVDGVSWSDDGGYYIISSRRRQYFGKSEAALWQAQAAHKRQTTPTPKWVSQDPNLLSQAVADRMGELADLGLDRQELHKNPELLANIQAQAGSALHPEYVRSGSPTELTREILTDLFGPEEAARHEALASSTRPDGESLTLSQVGETYRLWYLGDRGYDVSELQARALQARAGLVTRLEGDLKRQQTPRCRVLRGAAKRDGPSRKRANRIQAMSRKLARMSFVDLLEPTAKRAYREHQKYFGEFLLFMKSRHGGTDIAACQLEGADLRAYAASVVALVAQRRLTQKARNTRFQAVTTAFRRVKKRHPDAAWPQGFFGEDGTLAILEQKDTVAEAQKTLILAHEFHALVDVADTQWKSILYLSLNAALENTSVAEMEWRHLDLDRALMLMPRPKTGRPRQTPLAQATVKVLRAWQAESGKSEGRVFSTWQGTSWVSGTDSVGKHFELLRDKAKKATGHPIPATFKALRKTAASTAMAATHDERAVDFLLGHSPAKSWRHYVGFAPEFLHQAVIAIEREFFLR